MVLSVCFPLFSYATTINTDPDLLGSGLTTEFISCGANGSYFLVSNGDLYRNSSNSTSGISTKKIDTNVSNIVYYKDGVYGVLYKDGTLKFKKGDNSNAGTVKNFSGVTELMDDGYGSFVKNGTLYTFNVKTSKEAKVVDNFKEYYYPYALTKDNSLYDLKGNKITSGIKKISHYTSGIYIFLTEDNNLNYVRTDVSSGKISVKNIATNVKTWYPLYFYVLDNETYYIKGGNWLAENVFETVKVLDQEITDATTVNNYFAIGNTLYKYISSNNTYEEVTTTFKSFVENEYGLYYDIDGKIISYYTGKETSLVCDGVSGIEHQTGQYGSGICNKDNTFYYRGAKMMSKVESSSATYNNTFVIRTDGSVWQTQNNSSTESMTLLLNPYSSTNEPISKPEMKFSDVKSGIWYYNAVNYCYQNSIIYGTSSTTFTPDNNITRGELITILYRMAGNPSVSGTSKFSDVTNTKAFYYKAVLWATQSGVVHGYKNGAFGPNDNITREQLAVMLCNYAKYKGLNTSTTTQNLSGFVDNSSVSAYALDSVKWAVSRGVVNGSVVSNKKYLNPVNTATRAEAAGMIYNYCKNILKQ